MKRLILISMMLALSNSVFAVVHLTAYVPGTLDRLVLNWQNHPGTDEYRVFSSIAVGGPYAQVATVLPPTTTWTDVTTSVLEMYYVEAWQLIPPLLLVTSDEVGYYSVSCGGGSPAVPFYTPMGIPGLFYFDLPATNLPTYGVMSTSPSDWFDEQPACGLITTADRILRQDNGLFGYRASAGCVWTGLLEINAAMAHGAAYWYVNKTGASRTIFLAGNASVTGALTTPNCNLPPISVVVPAPVVPGTSVFTPISWPLLGPCPRMDVLGICPQGCCGGGLLADGFIGGTATTSDRVLDQTTGAFFWWRTTDNTAQGALVTVDPMKAYWIVNRHVGNSFTHTWPN